MGKHCEAALALIPGPESKRRLPRPAAAALALQQPKAARERLGLVGTLCSLPGTGEPSTS